METYTNLTLSFFRAIQQDVEKLYPEHYEEISLSFDWLLSAQTCDAERLIMVKALCTLGKAMEQSLISPKLLEVPSYFPLSEGSALPVFLHFLFEEVFYPSGLRRYGKAPGEQEISGEIASAVFVLRQILLAFSKAEDLPCNTEPTDELRSFIARVTKRVDHSVRYPTDITQQNIMSIAKELLRHVLTDADVESLDEHRLAAPLQQWIDSPFGRHGPGAVAGEERGFDKWDFSPNGITDDVTSFGPAFEPLYYQYEGEDNTSGVFSDSAIVTLVPKDFRGRRIICIEPKERMFAQRGLMEILFDIVHNCQLTRQSIDFNHQEKSQRFIQKRGISTIDLKDASDLVSLDLVKNLFPPRFVELVLKYRSPYLLVNELLPDDDGDWSAPHVFRYTTALTMGNALCFPIETLVFWSLSLATMIECSDSRLRNRALYFISGGEGAWTIHTFRKHFPLRVFGDDIAVPSRFYSEVCETLRQAGLSVNANKSCCETPVRESCGAWLFGETDVRITRFAFAQLSNTQVWNSWRANAIELSSNGFNAVAAKILEHLVEFHPAARASLGLQSSGSVKVGYRWNKDYQRVEVLVPTIREDGVRLHLNGEKGLYAHFTGQATDRTSCQGDAQRVKWQWVDVLTHLVK